MLKSTFRLLILIPFLIPVSAEAETKVSYYINLGGIKISDTTLSVNSNNEVWNIRSEISAAGIVDVIIEFRAFSESKGFIKGNKLIPETYSFSYETGKGRSRKGTLSYDTGIPFKLITQPEYDVDEKPDFDFLKEYGKETNDPYSALFVSGEFDDPCTYTAHGFDGIRAFKTKFVRPGKKENIVINDEKYEVLKCMGYFEPIIGYKPSEFLDEISKPGSVNYWYNYSSRENLWIPLKVIIETPLGGFVMKAVKVETEDLTINKN